MEGEAVVAVDVPLLGDERRKNWAKVVSNVDEAKQGGWAFEGEFIATGGIQDVTAPCVLLVYGESGSRANPRPEARVYQVSTDGTLSERGMARGRAWARTLRDTVAELVDTESPLVVEAKPWDPALMHYSNEALAEEQARRAQRAR